MRHTLRFSAALAVAAAAVAMLAASASAQDGAFVGHGCFLGPPEAPIEGIGGVVIAPNGTAVSRCIVPGSDQTVLEPQQCFLYTAGEGEIVVFMVTPNGTIILVCSNAGRG